MELVVAPHCERPQFWLGTSHQSSRWRWIYFLFFNKDRFYLLRLLPVVQQDVWPPHIFWWNSNVLWILWSRNVLSSVKAWKFFLMKRFLSLAGLPWHHRTQSSSIPWNSLSSQGLSNKVIIFVLIIWRCYINFNQAFTDIQWYIRYILNIYIIKQMIFTQPHIACQDLILLVQINYLIQPETFFSTK